MAAAKMAIVLALTTVAAAVSLLVLLPRWRAKVNSETAQSRDQSWSDAKSLTVSLVKDKNLQAAMWKPQLTKSDSTTNSEVDSRK